MKKTLAIIEESVEKAKEDLDKFVAGNNAAGSRVRKSMQEIKKLAQELRILIQNVKNKEKSKPAKKPIKTLPKPKGKRVLKKRK